jgi:hypothetical protein
LQSLWFQDPISAHIIVLFFIEGQIDEELDFFWNAEEAVELGVKDVLFELLEKSDVFPVPNLDVLDEVYHESDELSAVALVDVEFLEVVDAGCSVEQLGEN